MRVGYVRCSTAEQNEARQLKMMEEQKVEKIFIDKASGKNIDRKDFKAMMAFVRTGDTVIVESISRIARNTRDLLTVISSLTEKGVEFISLKENIDTTTPHGRFMLTVFGALAELERESILERQREGIEIAKAEGKYKGRKPVAVNEAKFRAVCARWRAGEITATAAMQEVGLKANTFYRRAPSKFFNFVKKNLPADWEKIKTFDRFACYFKGYQENRKNIYSSAAQNTSAAYRAVNENFPRFLNAVKIYKTFQDNYSDLVEEINTRTCLLSAGEDLSALLQIESYNRFLAQSGIDFFNKLIGEINYVINQYRQKNKQEKPRNLPFMPVLYKQILSDREKVFTANVFGNDNELITALQEFSTNIKSAEILGKQVDLFMALRQTLQALTEDSDLFVDAKSLDIISQKTTGSWDAFKTAMALSGCTWTSWTAISFPTCPLGIPGSRLCGRSPTWCWTSI